MEKLRLTDRKVLMTGASSGIGWAIAQTLIHNGAEVTVISRRKPSEWEKGPLVDWDKEKQWIQADIRNVADLIEKLRSWLDLDGSFVNVLIQSAISYGFGPRHSLLDTSLEEWDNVFMSNVRSEFAIIKTILPALMAQPASLIAGVSSDVVFKPGAGRITYAASKSASYSLHTGLADELKDTSVNVVELYPERWVATPGIQKRRPPGFEFSSTEYDSPDLFSEPLVPVVENFGRGLNGKLLVVRNNKLVPIHMEKDRY